MSLLSNIQLIHHFPVIQFIDRETGRVMVRSHNADAIKGAYREDDGCARCVAEKAVNRAAFEVRLVLDDQMHVKLEEKRLLSFSKIIQEKVLGVEPKPAAVEFPGRLKVAKP